MQRISKAVVMYDSIAICKQVTVKKRKAYDMAPPAPMAAGAEAERRRDRGREPAMEPAARRPCVEG